MTFEEMRELSQEEQKKLFSKLKKARLAAKTVNFAALYSVGAETLARNSGLSLKDSKKLIEVYWERNKAVKKAVATFKIKEIGNQKWVLNPISGFWLSLRSQKDIFSTINQSSAVYVFDTWASFIRQQNIKISLQMHDEVLFNTYDKELSEEKLLNAIKLTNEKLKLNVPFSISIAFGKNYSECH